MRTPAQTIEYYRIRMDQAVRKYGRRSMEARALEMKVELLICKAQRSGAIGTLEVGDDSEEDA